MDCRSYTAILHHRLCQWAVNMQISFVACMRTYAIHVLKNAKDIHKWTIFSDLLKHVEDVLKNVAGFLCNDQKYKKQILVGIKFLSFDFYFVNLGLYLPSSMEFPTTVAELIAIAKPASIGSHPNIPIPI
jgi:hypothetical protein